MTASKGVRSDAPVLAQALRYHHLAVLTGMGPCGPDRHCPLCTRVLGRA
jgi:hypothetical protein